MRCRVRYRRKPLYDTHDLSLNQVFNGNTLWSNGRLMNILTLPSAFFSTTHSALPLESISALRQVTTDTPST